MEPVVSVVIPAYKAAAFIDRAIASVQAQTLADFEIIVVDDASPDLTAEVVEKLAATDARIRLVRQERNGGPSAARNRGFAEARGTWIAILDADDAYLPGRLETLVDFAQSHELDMVADNIWTYDALAGRQVRKGFAEAKPYRPWSLHDLFANDIPHTAFVYGWLKPVFRRAFVERSGLGYRPEYRYGEDYLFYAELLAHGARALIVSEAFYLYTTRIGEISGTASGQSQTTGSAEEVLRASRWFRDTYAARLNTRELKAIMRREAAMAAYPDFMAFITLLRRRKAVAAVAHLLAKPQVWPFLGRAVKGKLQRR